MKKTFIFLLFLLAVASCTPRVKVVIPDSNVGAADTLLVRTDRIIRQ